LIEVIGDCGGGRWRVGQSLPKLFDIAGAFHFQSSNYEPGVNPRPRYIDLGS